MDKLTKIIVILGIALIIAIVIGIILPNINSANYNSIMKAQHNFTTAEINAIDSSSPIQIKHWAVFGCWANITKNITYQEKANFGLTGTSLLNVLYNNYYIPIYVKVQAFGNSAPNLIGQKVYLSFVINNDENISTSAPYIVKSEVIKNNIEYWNFTFDGNTSNAINSMLNPATVNITESYLNGIILLNQTGFLSPKNPAIYNLLHKSSNS